MEQERIELLNSSVTEVLNERKTALNRSGVVVGISGFGDFMCYIADQIYRRKWMWEIVERSSYSNRWNWNVIESDQYRKLKDWVERDDKEDHGEFYKYSWQATIPSELSWDAISDIFDNFALTLRGSSICGNPQLMNAYSKLTEEMQMAMNLIFLDFFEFSDGVEIAIELTKRKSSLRLSLHRTEY